MVMPAKQPGDGGFIIPEIIPIEPDTDNTGAGKDMETGPAHSAGFFIFGAHCGVKEVLAAKLIFSTKSCAVHGKAKFAGPPFDWRIPAYDRQMYGRFSNNRGPAV